jgi:uncharacterized protein (TIGR03437 family)
VRLYILLALPFIASAQLVQPTSIPKTPNPPVVFLNGYQFGCLSSVTFAGTFGIADQILQSNNIASVFFNNCSVPNSPSIEALGIAFGQFLTGLKYTDGTSVPQVDVVAHSMGGLIVRSYLAGKQDVTPAVFSPPATVLIRDAIFLATPNFGSGIANFLGSDTQTHEMALGSQFLFDLNTWNDANDDLRGVNALAIAGNGGTGNESGTGGFDDGVVTLTSASIGFARAGRTRVVPYCHTVLEELVVVNYCSSSAPGIADITSANDEVGQMIVSFLTGTSYWQSLGQAIEANTLGSTLAGVIVEAQDANGLEQTIISGKVSAVSPAQTASVSLQENTVAYAEAVPVSATQVNVLTVGSVSLTQTVHLKAGTGNQVFVKPGPSMTGAVTAGSAIFPFNVAADGYVAIYGSNLTTLTQPQSAGVPYPNQIGDVTVSVNGTMPAQLQYISPGQLNIVYPNVSPGLTQLTVKSSAGQQTINVLVAPAVPSIFTDSSGEAAALNGSVSGAPIVTSTAPILAGNVVELYVTGLGQTTVQADGLSWAQIQPTVTVGGKNCPVQYAGLVPGFTGFDQINCQIPGGITGAAVPVIVTSNGRASNAATLNIQ